MKCSKAANAVMPSLTRKLFNMAQEIGDDVINLTLGDPDVLPPIEIREAACQAIMDGKTRYSANAGLVKTREVYSDFVKREYGISVNPYENIIVTVGGMEALYLSLISIIDQNDEVIILGPYYVNYLQMIRMCGGKAVCINRLGKSDNELIKEIEEKTTEKTVAIIINSPCNPVGDILSDMVLNGIAKICCKHELWCISDEVYNSLVFDDKKVSSIYHKEKMSNRTIIIDSCSKRFAMTGWRIGFAIGPSEIISNMVKLQENVAACAPLPSQYAAIKAYSGDVQYGYIQEEYQKRRDLVYSSLKDIPGLNPIYPEATLYCYVDISGTHLNAEEFAYRLLEKNHVAVVPGNSYGEEYSHYIRIAFTLNEEKLQNAMKRISQFCRNLM